MIGLPETNFNRSVKAHNLELDVFCDWIESTTILLGERVSQSDVVDVLRENEIYASQDFAWEAVSLAWVEIRRRAGWLGVGSPMIVGADHVEPKANWQTYPGHSFCLCLSLAKWFPKWARQFGGDYGEQGMLFERLTAESLANHFPGWEIQLTGWSRRQCGRLREVAEKVAIILGESTGDFDVWSSGEENDAGLDIICFPTFEDRRATAPVLLFQCASGKHYSGKLHTPNLKRWGKLVTFTCDPHKAFSSPFALLDSEFKRAANVVDGLFLDRYRLLAPCRIKPDWLSIELAQDLNAWTAMRIATLPVLER